MGGMARMMVSVPLLLDALNLPKDTTINGATFSYRHGGEIEFLVTHPDLKRAVMGPDSPPPEVWPKFQRQEPVVFVGWGQD